MFKRLQIVSIILAYANYLFYLCTKIKTRATLIVTTQTTNEIRHEWDDIKTLEDNTNKWQM